MARSIPRIPPTRRWAAWAGWLQTRGHPEAGRSAQERRSEGAGAGARTAQEDDGAEEASAEDRAEEDESGRSHDEEGSERSAGKARGASRQAQPGREREVRQGDG